MIRTNGKQLTKAISHASERSKLLVLGSKEYDINCNTDSLSTSIKAKVIRMHAM
jgi:hypothetical protein